MRLIDADEYAKEMKCRQNAVETAIEHPRTDVYYTDKEHWEGVLCTYAEAKLTLDKMPSVPAVPLDKLCEWLAERYAVPCRAFDEPEELFCGQCYEEGISNVECWKRYMIKWMEGLNEAD